MPLFTVVSATLILGLAESVFEEPSGLFENAKALFENAVVFSRSFLALRI
jgi:hypothetical protein